MSNITAISSSACVPSRFLAGLFSVALHQDGTTAQHNTYASASDDAHLVLGLFLSFMVLCWCLYIMEFLSLRRAYNSSAAMQMAMGAYLLTWVFYFMYPQDTQALYEYSTRDLLQLQHAAIASLLLASGFIDVLQANYWLKASHWTLIWTLNMTMTGLLFLAHPQKTYGASVKHFMLGVSICFASILFARAKENLRILLWLDKAKHDKLLAMQREQQAAQYDHSPSSHRPHSRHSQYDRVSVDASADGDGDGPANPCLIYFGHSRDPLDEAIEYRVQAFMDQIQRANDHHNSTANNTSLQSLASAPGSSYYSSSLAPSSPSTGDLDWSMVFAGCCFAMAACILIIFKDSPNGPHYGTDTQCQAAWPLTQFGYVTAVSSVTAALVSILIYSKRFAPVLIYLFPIDGVCCRSIEIFLCTRSERLERELSEREERDYEERTKKKAEYDERERMMAAHQQHSDQHNMRITDLHSVGLDEADPRDSPSGPPMAIISLSTSMDSFSEFHADPDSELL